MFIKGSITALVTPMNEKGDLDYDSLEKLINHQINSGISGLVAVGTTGESATIDFKDHIKLIEFFVKVNKGRVHIIAGTGANSTEEALHLTKEAKSAGADAALLVSPYYNKPPQEGIYYHHMKIADEVDIPQILYNVPSRTASFIEPETVLRLSSHKNIIGIKDATGDMKNHSEVLKLCKEEIENNNFLLYSGDDFSSLEFLKNGGHGTISVTSNIVPDIVSEICKLVDTNYSKAKELDDSLKVLNKNLFCESNPIPVKWALYKMGLIKRGIRLPLVELNDSFKEPLENSLKKLNLI
ncbi:MAG: 4-hydroxy-tetrahydrodipicolinate synthase [Pseudomonadota bacterium]|jgi:4-hydroxy-tetrahydrodipicolinate synthase|nr:4-hydroxy-tetrahydrodipicolinate synthase [Pseudomonadota bacterium]|tara:strand:- start:286 stop:1176 length:891 start_codon:yes stop_codon:yes gene_type:complete